MISSHILDTSKGVPAAGVIVHLQTKKGDSWQPVETVSTNADGRVAFTAKVESGCYQLLFEAGRYFSKDRSSSFYEVIPVIFMIEDPSSKYHIPLLLSPFGYSTYRGS